MTRAKWTILGANGFLDLPFDYSEETPMES